MRAIIGALGTAFAITTLAAEQDSNRIAISTADAPAAIGPYSQAIRIGNMLFVSGEIAIDPKTNTFMTGASIEDQTTRVLDNLKAILAAGGMSLSDVVSATVFMTDLNAFVRMNGVYATYFPSSPPARQTVQVSQLPKGAQIEISLVAVLTSRE
jgi:2-iminobutanoate/2-iminopropanoate deaminase